jgi:hypothetical protein
MMTCARNFRGGWLLAPSGCTQITIREKMEMGKLTKAQVRTRLERTMEGLDPYVRSGEKAIPRGLNRSQIKLNAASDHPGSRKGFRPSLPVYTDPAGKVRVIWPGKKRKGRQAAAQGQLEREQRYLAQNSGKSLTGPQQRRLRHKLGHGLAIARSR